MGDKSWEGGKGWIHERSRVSVIIIVCARDAPKEGGILALSCQAFARLLLADLELVLWSRRVVAFMTDVRAFSAHLPLTSLFYSITVVALHSK